MEVDAKLSPATNCKLIRVLVVLISIWYNQLKSV